MCAVWSLSARKGVLSESSAILGWIVAKSIIFGLVKKLSHQFVKRILQETFIESMKIC